MGLKATYQPQLVSLAGFLNQQQYDDMVNLIGTPTIGSWHARGVWSGFLSSEIFRGWRVEVWGRLDDGIEENWVVVSKIFYFHPYLGKIPILTNIFQMGWNHQLEYEKKRLAGVYFLECIHPW